MQKVRCCRARLLCVCEGERDGGRVKLWVFGSGDQCVCVGEGKLHGDFGYAILYPWKQGYAATYHGHGEGSRKFMYSRAVIMRTHIILLRMCTLNGFVLL